MSLTDEELQELKDLVERGLIPLDLAMAYKEYRERSDKQAKEMVIGCGISLLTLILIWIWIWLES